MAPRVIRFPSREEEERARSFTVHKNYISALSSYILTTYGNPDVLLENLIAAQRSLNGFRNIQGGTSGTLADVRRYLTISWASELQLRLGNARDGAVLRYSNAWAPVHAYYAVYMGLQAWFAANSMGELVDDHSSSLRTIASTLSARQLLPAPFQAMCRGCPELRTEQYIGFPNGVALPRDFPNLARPTASTFWPRLATMLRTTRQRRLERNYREWKKSRGRKRMLREEKLSAESNLPPTTIFDFYWRLRIRSNYHDVSSFLTWNVTDLEHQEYAESLSTITDALCASIDSLVARKVGRARYGEYAKDFLNLSSDASSARTAMAFLDGRRAAILGPVQPHRASGQAEHTTI